MISLSDICGVRIPYAVIPGGKKPLVILPGISLKLVTPAESAVATAYAAFLPTHTIYLFDRRLDPPARYSVRDMACDTAAVIDSLGIRAADIFGASQGGMIAQCLAIDRPDLVSRLALASTVSRVDPANPALNEWLTIAETGDIPALCASVAALVYSPAVREVYGNALIAPNLDATASDLSRFITQVRACLSFDRTADAPAISCPVWHVRAEGDRIFPQEDMAACAALLHARAEVFSGVFGHAVYDESPDFAKLLLDFFTL